MNRFLSLSTRDVSRHRAFVYGFAAMWVLFFHMVFSFPSDAVYFPIRWVKVSGNCGVDVFCLLSGMGLYRSFSRDEKIMAFYGRRFVRVFLPAFIIIAYNAARLAGSGGIMEYMGRLTVLGYWAGASVLWYAPFILAMYLIYPALYHIQKKNSRLLWVVLLACLAFPAGAKIAAPEWAAHVEKAISRIPAFVIGCMLAPMLNEDREISIKWWPALIVPYAALRLAGTRLTDRYSYIFLAAFMIILMVKIAGFIAQKRPLHFVYKIFAFMGGISLEVYLFQERVREWVKPWGNLWQEWNELKLDMVTLIFTIILAVVLQKLCGMLIETFTKTKVPE